MATKPRKRKRRHPATKPKSATTPKVKKRKRVDPAPQKKTKKKAPAKPKRVSSTKSQVRRRSGAAPTYPRAPAAPATPGSFPKRQPAAKPSRRPTLSRPPKLSKHPEAIRSRKRRIELRAIAEQLAADKLRRQREAVAKRKATRKKKQTIGRPLTDAERAGTWLEKIREHCAAVFSCALEITYPGGGHADLTEDRDQHLASQRRSHLWLAVGRFEPTDEEIGYAHIAEALARVRDDLFLEARVTPQRLTQIRIVFHDEKSRLSESDSVVSKIGAYEYVLGDTIGELVGTSIEQPDADSLAARYDSTIIPKFYIFFSSEQVKFQKVAFGPKTMEVKLR